MPAYPGRPREFTYERRRELLEHVSQGATVEEAAQIVGLSLRTVQREAKHNEHFDHDLQLALHAAPVDPHQLVLRAARTHWRAAAWLLERTDPDRFAKRPPNSCSYGTLQDISDWLIETALEATPPEHREGVYRRMRGVADKALDVLMPDQHDARRRLVGSLPERPMPLSDHAYLKTLGVINDRGADAVGALSAPASGVTAEQLSLGAKRSSAWAFSTVDASLRGATRVSEKLAHKWPRRRTAEAKPPSKVNNGSVLGGVSDVDSARPRESAAASAKSEPAPQPCANEPAPQPTADRATSYPPNGGIMSPKMSAATKCDVTKLAVTDGPSIGRSFTVTRSPANPRCQSAGGARQAAEQPGARLGDG
jgi:hypothetical protein